MAAEKQNAAKSYMAIVMAVAEAIREAKEIPSGHLYSALMGHMNLDQYNQIIGLLKQAGKVQEERFLLTWVG